MCRAGKVSTNWISVKAWSAESAAERLADLLGHPLIGYEALIEVRSAGSANVSKMEVWTDGARPYVAAVKPEQSRKQPALRLVWSQPQSAVVKSRRSRKPAQLRLVSSQK
jgi:hypothetical protein